MRSLGSLVLCFAAALPAHSEDLSTISIPVSARLSGVEALANEALPGRLVEETSGQTCVEPQKACTKIPEFRGFKIYSRLECIELTPRIDCFIEQVVDRAGPMTIGGSRETLTVSQAFAGRATVRGRGEIGRHIQETATGSVRLSVSLTPRVTPDWKVEAADVRHSIDWTQTPTARLFNIFPVTFQTKATEALNREIEAFKANELPRELDKIDLKGEIAAVWAAIQSSVPVAMPNGSELFLRFRPSGVALAPFDVNGDRVSTRLSVTGRFLLIDAVETGVESVPLPALSDDPPPPHVSLTLPVEISLGALSELASAQLPARLDFQQPVRGELEIHSVDLSEAESGVLVAAFDASVTAFGIGPVRAPLTLTGTPEWNTETETLSLGNPEISFDGDGPVARFLSALASRPDAVAMVAELARVPLSTELAGLEAEISKALNRPLAEGVRAQGALEVSVTDIVLDEGLRLTVQAGGSVELTVLELN